MSSDDSLRAMPGAGSSTSVFSPHRLVSLLLTPRAYFAQPDLLSDRRGILIAAAIIGMTNVMGRIDQNLLKTSMQHRDIEHLDVTTSWMTASWSHYWLLAVCGGMVSAILSWYIAGWWYRKRLEWSGASDVAPVRARSISALQDLVYVLPVMLWTLIQTVSYPNYAQAWQAADAGGMLLLVFLLWSCWTSYCAATTAFTVHKNKARFWFLIMPVLFYLLFMGGLGYVMGLFR